MNNMLKTLYNKPDKIVDKKFSDKILILEAEEIIPSQIAIKIKMLNKIRNEFVHNLDYLPTKKELDVLESGLKMQKNGSQFDELKSSISGLIGYLQATNDVNASFPFLMHCIRRKNQYKIDMTFDFPEIFKVRKEDVKTALKDFRR